MIKKIICFVSGLIFAACDDTATGVDNYPNDPIILRNNGTPKDSLTFYLPKSIRLNGQITETKIDTFTLKWFSGDLYAAKEPILFNYYLERDIYRFLWLRSFSKPIVFVLTKSGNLVTLTTKMLSEEAQIDDLSYDPREWKGTESIAEKQITDELKGKAYHIEKYGDSLVVFKRHKTVSIILNTTKQLSKIEWIEFESILNECSFWTMKLYVEPEALDGSEWMIEGHLENRYWFVNRCSPKDRFRKAGEYLIAKSGIKEEIY